MRMGFHTLRIGFSMRRELMSYQAPDKHVHDLQSALILGRTIVTEVWSYATGDWVSSVYAADIDGDGDIEILLASRDCHIYALTKRGMLKWMQQPSGEWIRTVRGIDDGDITGKTRIVVGSRNNKVQALDENGELLWTYQTQHVVRKTRFYDINKDGQAEILVASDDQYIYALAGESGGMIWSYLTNGPVHALHVADIDGDGNVEILATSGDQCVYVLDGDGHLKWTYDAKSEIYAIHSADIDGDGDIEILLASNTKELYALTPQRREKWRYKANNRFLSLHVADFEKNGRQIIIAASEDKHLYFFNAHGHLLWAHNMNSQVFSVYASDLDNDDLIEILVGTEDSVHVLRVKLIENLRETIFAFSKLVKKLPAAIHSLSTVETTLLQDLTNERPVDKREITLASARQHMRAGDYLQALSMLVTLRQQRIQVLWSKKIGHIRAVFSGDLNGDGQYEVIAGTDEGGIYVFDPSGSQLWTRTFADRIWTVYVGDIDQDNTPEIVAGSAGGLLSVFSGTGETKWQAQLGAQIETVYIKETKAHNQARLVVGVGGKQGNIRVYDQAFSPAIEPIRTSHGVKVVGMIDIAEADQLGIIAAGDDDQVYAYTGEGALLWCYKTGDRTQGLALRDIDHDGHLEIIIGSEDRNVLVLDNMGHLKWRYYTSHRVLSVNALDVDQDGSVEVCVGTEDGYLYFLSSTGDLRWKYRIGDRVRGIQPGDVNGDGKIELIVGSEDQLLYLLQVLDPGEVEREIDGCWQALQHTTSSPAALLCELAHNPQPSLRAFALSRIVAEARPEESCLGVLRELVRDTSSDVRQVFAQEITSLYHTIPQHARRFIEILLADQERDVRLAQVDSLVNLVQIDGPVVFQYLERVAKGVDGWVRRAVARKLCRLSEHFPQRAFRLVTRLLRDDKEWVRQEAARTLAHYFDLYDDTFLQDLRILVKNNLDVHLLEIVAYYSTKPIIQDGILATAGLLMNLDESNVLAKLAQAVSAFTQTRALKYGEEIWQIYRELYHLHLMVTIDEISQYTCALRWDAPDDEANLGAVIHVLRELMKVSTILSIYLKRDRIGDRIVSLLEANSALDRLEQTLKEKEQHSRFLDRLLLEILLRRWRGMTVTEIELLRGKADLRPELRVKSARFEEQIGIWLDVRNEGRSPADNVRLTLKKSADIEIVGTTIYEFETIPASDVVVAEFIIKPGSPVPHLTFELVYDDAEARGRVIQYGDQLETRVIDRVFARIPNPYSVGTPIQTREMFYGHSDDLDALQEDLTSRAGNMVVVLYGQRRSGKSSLLYQLLNSRLAPDICVYIDMQHETLDLSTARLFYHLALAISRAISSAGLETLQPVMQDFRDDPTFAFDQFLRELEGYRGQRRLTIMLDEFEVLEQKVKDRILPPEIFEYLRSLMQHRRDINFLLAGTHTIEQLTKDYWSVFFNIARHHRLSKLQEEAARQLIMEPVRGYADYDPLAVEKIRQLAADQPYFIQLICRALITHCNESSKNYITINDVNIVQRKVMETGQVHFTWLWGQMNQQERFVLSIMAQEGGDEGRSLALRDLKAVYHTYRLPYDHDSMLSALENLVDIDLIERVAEGTRYRISIGLTRRWLLEAKPLRKVLLEENFTP